jgi:hypothetical protein
VLSGLVPLTDQVVKLFQRAFTSVMDFSARLADEQAAIGRMTLPVAFLARQPLQATQFRVLR